jgi:filamentous hemagglutinin family protein
MMTTTNHIINKYTAILHCNQINFSRFILNSVKFLLIYVLTFLPCLIFASNPVYAQTAPPETSLPIIPDGTTNTQIDHAANGVPIENIAAPNSSGISRNNFEQFNVNKPGLIINNSIGSPNDVVMTRLGGLIMDNPNLRNYGPATLIINEVTSNYISIVGGPQEIAGHQADYALINPNAVIFNGASFINVSRFTAVVGSVNGGINPNLNNLTFSLGSSDSIKQLMALSQIQLSKN